MHTASVSPEQKYQETAALGGVCRTVRTSHTKPGTMKSRPPSVISIDRRRLTCLAQDETAKSKVGVGGRKEEGEEAMTASRRTG